MTDELYQALAKKTQSLAKKHLEGHKDLDDEDLYSVALGKAILELALAIHQMMKSSCPEINEIMDRLNDDESNEYPWPTMPPNYKFTGGRRLVELKEMEGRPDWIFLSAFRDSSGNLMDTPLETKQEILKNELKHQLGDLYWEEVYKEFCDNIFRIEYEEQARGYYK